MTPADAALTVARPFRRIRSKRRREPPGDPEGNAATDALDSERPALSASSASHGATTAAAASAVPFADKNHFLLRRLHSLTGIVPVGVFLIEHLLTNSRAFGWFGWFGGGRAEFNKDVHWIHNLPFLFIVEVLFIFLPLAFHAGYGVKIALSAEPNQRLYPYGANWRFVFQRATGFIALAFIIVHLLKFRFAHLVGWNMTWPTGADGAHVGYVGSSDPYQLTWLGFHAWQVWGQIVPAGMVFAFYIIGLWSAVYHFCNGIWTFCITWGITIGERAQQRVGYVCIGLAAVLLAWGHASLYAFSSDKKPESAAVTPAAGHIAAESDDSSD